MLADRTKRIAVSPTMKVTAEALKLKAQGVDVLDFGIQLAIHQRHLHFELEVRDGAQTADDDSGAAPTSVIHEQPVEGVHFDIRHRAEDSAHDLHALVHREKRRLLGIHQNGHDDPVEQSRAARNDIDVPVRQRIEGTGIDSKRGHRDD